MRFQLPSWSTSWHYVYKKIKLKNTSNFAPLKSNENSTISQLPWIADKISRREGLLNTLTFYIIVYCFGQPFSFLTFPVCFCNTESVSEIFFSSLNPFWIRSGNLKEQVHKAFCFKNYTDLSLFVNCLAFNLKFQKFFSVTRKFFITACQNNFGKQNTTFSLGAGVDIDPPSWKIL